MEKLKPNCIVFFNGEIEGLEDALRTCAELGAQDFFFVVRDRDLKAFSKYAMSEGGFDLITENKENANSKFTPGPWEAGRNPAMATVLDDQEGKAIYQKGKDGCHHIGWANIHDDEGKLDMETAIANAALIAASPEMYALLSNILNDLETDGSISLDDNAANDIRMLLAKARGEGENG